MVRCGAEELELAGIEYNNRAELGKKNSAEGIATKSLRS
jgi:hypothetical protein